jgi:hypothetical protein
MAKIETEKREPPALCCGDDDKPSYPWGTEITLRDELATEVAGDAAVGQMVAIKGMAFISAKRETPSDNSIDIQLTEITATPVISEDRAKILYGEGEG